MNTDTADAGDSGRGGGREHGQRQDGYGAVTGSRRMVRLSSWLDNCFSPDSGRE